MYASGVEPIENDNIIPLYPILQNRQAVHRIITLQKRIFAAHKVTEKIFGGRKFHSLKPEE